MFMHLMPAILKKSPVVPVLLFFLWLSPLPGQPFQPEAVQTNRNNIHAVFQTPAPMMVMPEEWVSVTSYGTFLTEMEFSLYHALLTTYPEVYLVVPLQASLFLFAGNDWGAGLGWRIAGEEGLLVPAALSPFHTFHTATIPSGLFYRIRLERTPGAQTGLYLSGGLEWAFAGLDLTAEKPAVSALSARGYRVSIANNIPVDLGWYAGASFIMQRPLINYYLDVRYGESLTPLSSFTSERAPRLQVQASVTRELP